MDDYLSNRFAAEDLHAAIARMMIAKSDPLKGWGNPGAG